MPNVSELARQECADPAPPVAAWLDAPDRPGWWFVCYDRCRSLGVASVIRLPDRGLEKPIEGWLFAESLFLITHAFRGGVGPCQLLEEFVRRQPGLRWLPIPTPDIHALARQFAEQAKAEEIARLKARLRELGEPE